MTGTAVAVETNSGRNPSPSKVAIRRGRRDREGRARRHVGLRARFAGGTKGFEEALEPFGLKPADPAFWTDALDAHLGSLMDEAEALAKKLAYAN